MPERKLAINSLRLQYFSKHNLSLNFVMMYCYWNDAATQTVHEYGREQIGGSAPKYKTTPQDLIGIIQSEFASF